MALAKRYRTPAVSLETAERIRLDAEVRLGLSIDTLGSELCYYIETDEGLSPREAAIIEWLVAETFEPQNTRGRSCLPKNDYPMLVEVGPRNNFESPDSSVAISVCQACGIDKVTRLEASRRFGLSTILTPGQQTEFLTPLHDKMTQVQYRRQPRTFQTKRKPKKVQVIDILKRGPDLLRKFSEEFACGWDDYDIEWIYDLFRNVLKFNPTDVVLFQIAQAITAEHSRHQFWKGKHVIDGVEQPQSLWELVNEPIKANRSNSKIALTDDSSSIKGPKIRLLVPLYPDRPGPVMVVTRAYNPTLTAETHNWPTLVEPFEGSSTGTGGRTRDGIVVGRGGLLIISALGIMVGNLHLPGYKLSWEDDFGWESPNGYASPDEIMLNGSKGAYYYGNCIGECCPLGTTRSISIETPDGRRGYSKPILYTMGGGQMEDQHSKKPKARKGQLVVVLGGRGYRIGVGGGSTSSVDPSSLKRKLAFDAVQRGEPWNGRGIYEVIAACVRMGRANKIRRPGDCGAGGLGNQLLEIVSPTGGTIELRDIPIGDQTLQAYVIVSNESQERIVILIEEEDYEFILSLCQRFRVLCKILGRITGDGWFTITDRNDGTTPVRLPLDRVLENLPRRTYYHTSIPPRLRPLVLPSRLTPRRATEQVFRLISVGSKRALVEGVDCSVTGRVAQQQRVGPNGVPIADFAAVAQSMIPTDNRFPGIAYSLGEQPVKGLIDPRAMTRMSVAEALLNIAGAHITDLEHIKFSANWMWAAKELGEGANLYWAVKALKDICLALGIAIDGGKDSLSMLDKRLERKRKNRKRRLRTIKAPGTLIVSFYATMKDVRVKVTPDLKRAGNTLVFVDLANGKNRLGGSALAQVHRQIGNEVPDVEDPQLLVRAFRAVQLLVESGQIASIHDRSDGGLLTTLCEMAFAGNLGVAVDMKSRSKPLATYFSEELGLVIETADPDATIETLRRFQVPSRAIGEVTARPKLLLYHNGRKFLEDSMLRLRAVWEETSDQLDALQSNPRCVKQAAEVRRTLLSPPPYHLTFTPRPTPQPIFYTSHRPQAAVICEEGTNGYEEMWALAHLAGYRAWNVWMTDLLDMPIDFLDRFQTIFWPGGFTFRDIFGAGKGQAGVIRFNPRLQAMFDRFYRRLDTLSLGVCNGAQLSLLLKWASDYEMPDELAPRLVQNDYGRFRADWVTVGIEESPAVALEGMAGSRLGIWIAHGEGRLRVEQEVLDWIIANHLAPIRYLDRDGQPTEVFPFCPSGSPLGIAGICSPDGRHLAMMPHPERCGNLWNWMWLPEDWQNLEASPWLRLFQNMFLWCFAQARLARQESRSRIVVARR